MITFAKLIDVWGVKAWAKLAVLCGCALLVGCGGGGGDSSGSGDEGPTRLYPSKVLSGTVSIRAAQQLELTVTYASSDVTQGLSYTGVIEWPTTGQAKEEESKTYIRGTMRQTDETTPGHLVFYCDGVGEPLQGRLAIILPGDSQNADTTAHTRTGAVDASTNLRYYSDPGYTTLNLAGATLTITWAE